MYRGCIDEIHAQPTESDTISYQRPSMPKSRPYLFIITLPERISRAFVMIAHHALEICWQKTDSTFTLCV
jgi:hypothetical protein